MHNSSTTLRLAQALILLSLAWLPAWANDIIPVEAFASPPDISYVRLSPNGKNLAFLLRVSGDDVHGTAVRIFNTETGEVKDLAAAKADEFRVNRILWANDEQLLMSAVFPAVRDGTPTTETRLIVFDIETGEDRSVLSKRYLRKHDFIPQIQDDIVDLLPSDEDHILLAGRFTYYNESRLLKINLRSGKVTVVVHDEPYVYSWATDEQERVRLAYWREGTEYRIKHKALDSRTWDTLWQFEAFSDDEVWPMGFGKDPNTLYVSAYHEGRRAIFKVQLTDPELRKELVFSHPKYDADGSLVYSKVTGDVIGTRFSADGGLTFWDPAYKAFQESIDLSLPNTSNYIYDMSSDERRYLLHAASDTDAGMYYIGDRDKNQATPIARRYAALDPRLMAEKKKISYRARDGLEIEGFLTLPNGEKELRLPAIVFPHGGPISADDSGFDYWTQFFANRGFAVLQMNFRGSGGYGFDFMVSGLKAWGLEMQNDVEDGTRWLIEEGIADPDRICVVGASYGGYAALMEAARNPDLYRCAVSFAGVTDVAYLVRKSRRYSNSEIVEQQIGRDLGALRQRSPLHVADDIEIPVLLGHGTDDRSVRIEHGRRINKALEDGDKDVTYLEFEGGDHYLSNEQHRLQFFEAMDEFLGTHTK